MKGAQEALTDMPPRSEEVAPPPHSLCVCVCVWAPHTPSGSVIILFQSEQELLEPALLTAWRLMGYETGV